MSELNALLARYFERGDAAAMEEIVRQTRGRLLAAARRIGNSQDAEDSVQATYHALLRRGDRPLDAPLIAWLLTVVVRIAFRRKAIQQREPQIAEQLAVPSSDVGPRRTAEILERDSNLRAEIACLPAHYRDTVVLRYIEGLSVSECARILEVPEETVRSRLKRARRLLRSRLHPKFAGLAFLVPWWLADSARAASSWSSFLGVALKSKIAFVAVLVCIAGLLFVARDLFRSDSTAGNHRSDAARVTTRSPASALANVEATVGGGPASLTLPSPIDLDAVDRDRDVHGTVVRSDGSPIAGAELKLLDFPWRRANVIHMTEWNRSVPGPATLSASDGTFRIPWQRAQMGWLNVSAAGLADRQIPWVQAGERLRIELDEGSEIFVRARNSAGDPVVGATVRFFHSRSRTGTVQFSGEHLGKTDAEGNCLLTGVNGPSVGFVELDHDQLGSAGWTTAHVPEGGGRVELDIEYPAARTLRGRVLDSETHTPVAGASVGIGWMMDGSVKTAADGSYELPGWTASRATEIYVAHAEYGGASEVVDARTEVDFALHRGDHVIGRVINTEGAALSGARIAAIGSVYTGQTQTMSRVYGTSKSDGTFLLTGLNHAMDHSVVVMRAGFGRVLYDIQAAQGKSGTIDMGDIVLRPGLTLECRVVDGSDAPLSRMRVTIDGANLDRGRYKPARLNQNLNYGERERRVTDDLGRVRFGDLAAGSYVVTATHVGGSKVERTVELTETDMSEVLLVFQGSRPVTIRVRDDSGEPIAGAFVYAGSAEGRLGGRTDGSGETVFLAGGVLTDVQVSSVTPTRSGAVYLLPPAIARLADDQQKVEIVLRRAETIAGVVHDPEGKPVPHAWVEAFVGGDSVAGVGADEVGHFRLTVAPDSRVDIVYGGLGLNRGLQAQEWEGRLSSVSAGARDLVLRLAAVEAGRSVRVLLLDPDGEPLEGWYVRPVPISSGTKLAKTDAEGRGTFTNMLNAKCRLIVLRPPGVALTSAAPKSNDFVPDGQLITLRFRRAIQFRGRILGSIAANVTLYRVVDGKQVRLCSAAVDREGNFVLFVAEDEGNGPFLLMAYGRGTKGVLAARAENVFLDGPAIEMTLK